jgi:diguanylate cyclase (GGDEF)-like protein/PAS domain S-box-containing protein
MARRGKTKAELVEQVRQLEARLAALDRGQGGQDPAHAGTAPISAREHQALFETTPDIVFSLSADAETILSLNPALEKVTGWPRAEWTGKPFRSLVHVEDLPVVEEKRRQVLGGKTPPPYELRIRTKSGAYLTGEFTTSPQVENGKVVGVLGIVHDVTKRKELEETMRRLAYYDAVTGLPNRVLFNDRLHLAMAHARRYQQKLAVMLLDLDRFKNVNDGLGHAVGDRLLRAVGERLAGLLRKSDTVARLGGDEFMLLLPEVAHEEHTETIARKILEAIRAPFVFGNQELHITTSIGIAIYPTDGDDPDDMMRNADIAMYRAKDLGRDAYQRYTSAMSKEAGS